ncbi:MAG: peptide chain release factor-like protein [Verrucomicrobia bacterium]|nr:peptide chain release factor-like protein [Verrucomicrobiota bacterium]MBU6446761.1 peptide chain release factor-like protein [Verrucomicrobiota bacterium]MDE3047487.1 peptide chain release factor-like protein [Verrucomicrobiota bacterium]
MIHFMDKWDEVKQRMERLGIFEGDLLEKFILGSGSGGQKINKTSSCVYLKHLPSGLEIKCQKSRSRDLNRLYARRELCERVEGQLFQEKSERQQKMEKLRRQKRKRSKRAQKKVLEAKKKLSTKKQLRKPPSE